MINFPYMFKRQLKIGFIKGGQLGKMMLQVAPSFDICSLVMDDDPNCPCRHLCHEFVLGDASNYDDVYAFGKKVELLTFEYEHVNVEALKKLKAEGLSVYPDPSILEMVQDKSAQKNFYRSHQIPTADFRLISNRAALKANEDLLPAMQKTCKAGYDGKGVFRIATREDIIKAFDEPSILERFVDFKKEIAVIVARNNNGEIVIYPTVEMVFHPTKNLVEFLQSPANITREIDQEARRIAVQLATQLQLVGVLAVEMFVTKDDKVLVNEIAPRVHNSGHHSIEGNFTSQFEQHLRAVMGLPLGNPDITNPSVMVNILGEDGYEGKARYVGVEEALALGSVYIHLYGKDVTKPYRKMGHATIVDVDIMQALDKARRVKEMIKVRT